MNEQAKIAFQRGYLAACCNVVHLNADSRIAADVLGQLSLNITEITGLGIDDYHQKVMRQIQEIAKPNMAGRNTHQNSEATTKEDIRILYSARPDNSEPDWSNYICLDLGEGIDENSIMSNAEIEKPYFTIYGNSADVSEAITDADTFDEAIRLGNILSNISGLRLKISA